MPSQKVYATCEGPKVTLAYVPKVCILDEATQQVSGQALGLAWRSGLLLREVILCCCCV